MARKPRYKSLGLEGRVPEPVPESRLHFFLAQREEVACPRSHSTEVTEPEL